MRLPLEHGYEFDVFVSYVESDDTPVGDGETPEVRREPCVGFFKSVLSRFAENRLGRPLEIADAHGGARPEQAAAFVAVISRRYAMDMEQMDRVDEYVASHGEDPERMFLAVREPVASDQLLEVLQKLQDSRTYDLFGPDRQTLLAHVFRAANSLAKDLVAAITGPAGSAGEAGEAERDGPGARTVFLAHTDDSLREARERLRASLESAGSRVLPRGPAAADAAAIEADAERDLAQATLSIHLLGASYDDAAEIQFDVAGERAAAGDLERYVWLGASSETADRRIRKLMDEAESSPAGTKPFRATDLDRFEEHVRSVLAGGPGRASGSRDAPPAPDYPYVYLVYNPRDEKWKERFVGYLSRHGIRWLPPPTFDDESGGRSPTEVAAEHQRRLEICSFCVVLYGEATEQWWTSTEADLAQVEVTGGLRVDRGYYLFEPMTEFKFQYDMAGTLVIKAGDRVTEEDLKPVLDALLPPGKT